MPQRQSQEAVKGRRLGRAHIFLPSEERGFPRLSTMKTASDFSKRTETRRKVHANVYLSASRRMRPTVTQKADMKQSDHSGAATPSDRGSLQIGRAHV